MRLKLSTIAFCGLLGTASAAGTRYEAESATLSATTTVTSATASNGAYVKMEGGNITFAVTAATKATYTLLVHYVQTYGATKTQNLVVNGTSAGTLTFPQTATFTDIESVLKLNAGANTIAITNSWGWVDIDYIELSAYTPTPFALSSAMATPNASLSAKKIFSFMQENFQKKIISGVMTNEVMSGSTPLDLYAQTEVAFVKSSSTKTPALVGFDFLHATGLNSLTNSWHKSFSDASLAMAKQLYNLGGIPQFTWHWMDPTDSVETFYCGASYSPHTNFNFTKACTDTTCATWNTSSTTYAQLTKNIDTVASYLKKLQTAGVSVVWRPLHEPSGAWFWWGARGPTAYKALYKLVFNRLTGTHGLTNLIWVWNSDGNDSAWYPGAAYVDIIGRDFYYYPRETNHSSLMSEFVKLKTVFGTSKMIALSENGSVPYPDSLVADGAGWSYFMPWYGDYAIPSGSFTDNTAAAWSTIMKNSYVITLENMPGWSNYTVSVDPRDTRSPAISWSIRREGDLVDWTRSQAFAKDGNLQVVGIDGREFSRGKVGAGTATGVIKAPQTGVAFLVIESDGIREVRPIPPAR